MKYLLDEKNNKEIIYAMNPDCDTCNTKNSNECLNCPYFFDGCFEYTEVYSGEISSSFLEFISLDFEEVKNNVIQIMKTQIKENNYRIFSKPFNDYFKQTQWLLLYLGITKKLYYEFKIPSDTSVYRTPLTEDILNNLFDNIIVIQKIITAYSENKDFINHKYLIRGIMFYEIMKCPDIISFEKQLPLYLKFLPHSRDTDIITVLKKFADEYSSIEADPYEFSHIKDMFGASFEWIVKNDYPISVCQNCGKFFVPYKRNDAKYCSHIFKDNKTCRELAFEIKVENDDVLRLYRKIYKTKNAWKNRNKKNSPNAEKAFDEWHKSAKQKVDDFNARKISKEECMTWLENSRRRE